MSVTIFSYSKVDAKLVKLLSLSSTMHVQLWIFYYKIIRFNQIYSSKLLSATFKIGTCSCQLPVLSCKWFSRWEFWFDSTSLYHTYNLSLAYKALNVSQGVLWLIEWNSDTFEMSSRGNCSHALVVVYDYSRLNVFCKRSRLLNLASTIQ